ncbi:MAG: ribonucleotide-diphosphate reductase subunit beta [Pseudomonadales bacterium]|jgi:ribonucleoside-diphosphate reductase beta chain|nr:ribonucleotide-diphosphate reductase subunit beta [Pseudomonadales bacterium]MDP6471177.1 ribonucleotide-diphosphate reductase subunit beta [Pseudomonadales bacterium]MDP6825636.1 ribonucleotide-diphosphate reductase subunit beta [Pseudomonadales bacterium]MDP6970449.1 ribonucleotide-diphosphate reductase subunit beta [Pseudomonadales bacterium]|tara:strand:+ start:488 stop:1663 length:1176 start_codon:yes stop_codon:yes gene_type:complete
MLTWDAFSEPDVQLPADVIAAESSEDSSPDPKPRRKKEAGQEGRTGQKRQTGQVEEQTAQPIRPEDKRVINGLTDINQLAPFKYPWAWKYFLNANKNHWTPLDINMSQDVYDYKHKLTDTEKHLYENVLAYLTTSDILAMRNIGLAVMEKMTAPELQIYQARQVYEEALHTWTYQHCIETLGLDQGEIYNRYRMVPAINQKIQIANTRISSILRTDIDLNDPDELNNFIVAYVFFAAVFEGCWFYNGFSPIFSFQRRGLMKGTAEQLQYIMRDEVLHCGFGIRTVSQIIMENDIKLDLSAIREMWDEAEAAEADYARYILRDPVLGYSAESHIEHFRFIANRRAKQLGFEAPFPGAQCALPWLDEQANIRKEKNFFETRVTEYQAGGLNWD